MEWVKLASAYYQDPKVAALPDADCEAMFLRSIAYCGLAETAGFVATGVLLSLGRRSHKRCARELVRAGLWDDAPGGWVVTRWSERQAELQKIVDKRRRDAERKRLSRGLSADCPRTEDGQSDAAALDSPRTVAPSESESESEVDLAVKSRSRHHLSDARTRIDDVDLEAISKALGGCEAAHAERVATDILSRSTEPVDKPTGYVLRSIGREPERYKPTLTPDRLPPACEHGRKLACRECGNEDRAREPFGMPA